MTSFDDSQLKNEKRLFAWMFVIEIQIKIHPDSVPNARDERLVVSANVSSGSE